MKNRKSIEQEKLEDVTREYNTGNFGEAFVMVNNFIESYPDEAEAHFLKANIFHIQGKIGSAIKSFKKVLELNKDHTDAMISLSVLYNDIGRYDQAKVFFELADKKVKKGDGGVIDNHINRKFSALHFEIAEMYYSYGRYDEALIEYNKARALNEEDLAVRVKIAKVYGKKRFFAKAVEELKELKQQNPNYIPARLALGLHFYSNGKIIEAQNEWRNIVHKEPKNKEANMYLKLSQSATEVTL